MAENNMRFKKTDWVVAPLTFLAPFISSVFSLGFVMLFNNLSFASRFFNGRISGDIADWFLRIISLVIMIGGPIWFGVVISRWFVGMEKSRVVIRRTSAILAAGLCLIFWTLLLGLPAWFLGV
jgi:hypothetical protein